MSGPVWPLGAECVVCAKVLTQGDGFNGHARLGKAWCWGHEPDAVNNALGEDITGHTLWWHMPRREATP